MMLIWAGPHWLCFARGPASTVLSSGSWAVTWEGETQLVVYWAWGSNPSC